jgi:hypothetical protein
MNQGKHLPDIITGNIFDDNFTFFFLKPFLKHEEDAQAGAINYPCMGKIYGDCLAVLCAEALQYFFQFRGIGNIDFFIEINNGFLLCFTNDLHACISPCLMCTTPPILPARAHHTFCPSGVTLPKSLYIGKSILLYFYNISILGGNFPLNIAGNSIFRTFFRAVPGALLFGEI